MALSDLKEKIEELVNHKVKSGWSENVRYMDTGQPIAQVALWQEYGTNTIPPRPFIRPALIEHKKDWTGSAKILAKRYFNDDIKLQAVFDGAGTEIVGDIRNSLDELPEDLSEITLLLRRWKDEGLVINKTTVERARQTLINNPAEPLSTRRSALNDTGQMRDSLDSTMVDS
jgi:hypothetical protein